MRKPRCECRGATAETCHYKRYATELRCRCECHKQGALPFDGGPNGDQSQQSVLPGAVLDTLRKLQLEQEVALIRRRIRSICSSFVTPKRVFTTKHRAALAIRALEHAQSVRAIELAGLPFPPNLVPAPYKFR